MSVEVPPTRVSFYESGAISRQEWLKVNTETTAATATVPTATVPTATAEQKTVNTVKTEYHRIDGPALISFYENGDISLQEWYENGLLHRLDGPASVYTDVDNNTVELWMVNGRRHRVGGPAVIINKKNYYSEEWFEHGIIHRLDGPAYTCVQNGVTEIEQYFKNGAYHRVNGPANTVYYSRKKPTGDVHRTLWIQEWFENGKYQDGPSSITYKPDGSINKEDWYENGKKVSRPPLTPGRHNLLV